MFYLIDSDLYTRLSALTKQYYPKLHKELTALQLQSAYALEDARRIKTNRKKHAIKSVISALHAQNLPVTKYQVHKQTKIAYTTLNKYFDAIYDEVKTDER